MNYKKIKLPAMLGLFGMLNTAAYSQIYMCQKCPAGTYQSGNSCVSCPQGVSSNPGSSYLIDCNIFNGPYTIEKTIADLHMSTNGEGKQVSGTLEPGLYLVILGGGHGSYAGDTSPNTVEMNEGWRHYQVEGTPGGRLVKVFLVPWKMDFILSAPDAADPPDLPCYYWDNSQRGYVLDRNKWRENPRQCSEYGGAGNDAYLELYNQDKNKNKSIYKTFTAIGGYGSMNYIYNLCDDNFEAEIKDDRYGRYKGGWISTHSLNLFMEGKRNSEFLAGICPGKYPYIIYYTATSRPTGDENGDIASDWEVLNTNAYQFKDKQCENCAILYKLK